MATPLARDALGHPLVVPTKEAFVRTLEEIRAMTANDRIHDATYQLEVLSAALWPDKSGGGERADRWKDYRLTGIEGRMADAMFMNLGKTVTRDAFFNHCYFDRPSTEDLPDYKTLDVRICHVRKKLKDSPYLVESVWGLGYRMELKPT